jgi:choline dehydrogenase-like flavoprotein
VLLPPALATGRLTIVTRAMAREITVDDQGLASGVSYIDKSTGRENHVRGRIVVLAASACESARLLLNSKSGKFPQGLANSSGVVGRYLTDTTGTAVRGFIPRMMSSVPHNEDGASGAHLYMPWWLDNRKLDFPRGYHIEIGGGRRMPGFGTFNSVHLYNGEFQGKPIAGGGYGKQLKDDYRRFYGATVSFAGRGEMVPNKDCYCEIDPAAVDQWGIPVLRFHWKWTDHEYNQVKHMQETFRAIIHEMGGTPMSPMPGADVGYGIETGGRIIHEIGTTRMGNDPSSSVVNSQCQAHDVRNLFITDGGPFVSNPHKNVTWSILALSMRTSEHIAEGRKKGEL